VPRRPGEQIVVTVNPAGSTSRMFVHADGNGLVVLNDRLAGLTPEVLTALAKLVRTLSARILAAQNGEVVHDANLMIGPEGLAVDGRPVAALTDLVESVDRSSVVEVVSDGPTVRQETGKKLIWAGLGSMMLGAALKNPEAGPSVGWYAGVGLIVTGAGLRHSEAPRTGLIYRRAARHG
jgi:hypothetical protein